MESQLLEEISSLIDEIALKAITLESNDVATLGELLNLVETLKEKGASDPLLPPLSRSLVNLIEAVILKQDEDLSVHMNLLSEGISLLQNRVREIKAGEPGSVEPLRTLAEKMKQAGVEVELPPEEAAGEGEEEAEAAPETGEEPEEAAGKTDAGEPEEGKEEEKEEVESPPAESPEEKGGEEHRIVDEETCYEFINETLANLETVEPTVVELESDPSNKELINAIFRCFHTAKGVSGFLNLQRMNHYTHELENLLDEIRNDRLPFDDRITDFILNAFDFLRKMLSAVQENLDRKHPFEPAYDVEPQIRAIHELLEGKKPEKEEEEGKAVEEPSRVGEILVSMGKARPEEVQEALKAQEEAPDLKIGEILTGTGSVSPKDVNEALKKQRTIETTVRVSTEKLDQMVDMVGELVIAQALVTESSLVQQAKDQKLLKNFSQLHRITSELQKTAMSMRMVPVRQTFQKMVRLVRDLSRKSGKEVQLTMSGEDTEIDRSMVDDVYDPLVHMVRNAVDHGLESPEEREAAGKPRVGHVHLSAYHQGGSLYIEIQDDGRGLDRDKILQKAIERNLVNPNATYSDHEIHNFIFLPGFSTAETVTDISGRGVGMDVVKKFVERIRGSVEIKSERGVGSTFVIKLPLTLAIIDGIVALVGNERYIIPAQSVKESLQAKREQFVTVSGKGEAIHLRGKIFPLIRLHKIFDIPSAKTQPEETILVVVEHEGKEACLMLDDLVGKQEVVIKSLGKRLSHVKGFSGGTILGDGRVGLILDIKGIFEIFEAA